LNLAAPKRAVPQEDSPAFEAPHVSHRTRIFNQLFVPQTTLRLGVETTAAAQGAGW